MLSGNFLIEAIYLARAHTRWTTFIYVYMFIYSTLAIYICKSSSLNRCLFLPSYSLIYCHFELSDIAMRCATTLCSCFSPLLLLLSFLLLFLFDTYILSCARRHIQYYTYVVYVYMGICETTITTASTNGDIEIFVNGALVFLYIKTETQWATYMWLCHTQACHMYVCMSVMLTSRY